MSVPERARLLAWLTLGVVVGCPKANVRTAGDICIQDARRLAAQDDLPAALTAVETCRTQTAKLAEVQAQLLYRMGRPSADAWALAYQRAKDEGRDADLIARTGWAYAQVVLEAGDIRRARTVSNELEARRADFAEKFLGGHAYLRALVVKAEGRIEEAHRRFDALAKGDDPLLAHSARVARANLWGATGRSARALAELRALLNTLGDDDKHTLADVLHAAAWAGVLAIEELKGREGKIDRSLLEEVRGYYQRLASLDRAEARKERLAALQVERAWLAHLAGEPVAREARLPKTAPFPRDRGYLALLQSQRLLERQNGKAAGDVLLEWLKAEGDTDPELALRMYLVLSALGRTKASQTAWRLVGRRFLATHTLSGRSDVLARFRPAFVAEVVRRIEAGDRRAAFGLAAVYTGAPFRRLRLQSCLSDPESGLEPLVRQYWALQEQSAKAERRRGELSVQGLARHREQARARAREQIRLLDTIDRRCAVGARASWARSIESPAKTHDRIQASLEDREALVLPFGQGLFVVTKKTTEYLPSSSIPSRDALERMYVVHEPDRELPRALSQLAATTAWYLPAAGWLEERRTSPTCRGSRPPVIVSDTQSDLPFSRRAGRRLAERYSQAQHLAADAATVAAVQAAWQDAKWFFFGGHSVIDADSAEPELLLADGRLDPARILLQGQPPCIAVLLSCETAVRKTGERPRLGLVDALLAAGTHAVVATASRIEDRVAGELSKTLALETSADVEASLKRTLPRLADQYPGLASEIQVWGAVVR